ncbi:hypothetical protein NC652_030868 [Populus alba x Populus x berolinensis]|uniref:Uncharacterized protein n=1 Tax=Populus tomentosa TaxID=118781 RepID=A0A8X7YIJ8_POPTO|nr:hypothetical protein POTOM_043943 [Populus tomentosa]KAJ6883750.1 hypothetical protein NC652_030868 [Populus alba x Populus x berolinensis]
MSPSMQRRRQHQLQLHLIRGDGALANLQRKREFTGVEDLLTRSSFALPTTEAIKKVVAQTHAAERKGRAVEDAAATRIPAVFRSYLARKALCALRGLVKLQALVRGHQLRKQTTATLRRMHTLMAIQARARCHRVQMAGESQQLAMKRKSSRH